MRKLLPWLSLVFAGFWPAADLLVANPELGLPPRLVVWCVAIVGAAAVCAFAVSLLIGSFNRAAAIAGPATIAFFCFAWIEPASRRALAVAGYTNGAVLVFVLIWALLVGLLVLISRDVTQRRALLILPLFFWVTSALAAAVTHRGSQSHGGTHVPAQISGAFSARPNVYHFLFDGLARPDNLSTNLAADVHNEVEGLRLAGLDQAPHAETKYLTTVASINGIFNPARDTTNAHDLIASDTPVVRAFRSQGYRYVQYGEVFAFAACKGTEDLCLNQSSWKLTELDITMLRRTPLYQLFKKAILSRTASRDLSDNLLAVARVHGPSPTFTFIYMVPPHPPFMFDGKCDFDAENAQEFTRWDRRWASHYVQGYRCVLRALIPAIQRLRKLDPGAIIFATGDHGSMFRRVGPGWSEKAIAERKPVFVAYRVPTQCASAVRNLRLLSDLYPTLFRCLDHVPGPAVGQ